MFTGRRRKVGKERNRSDCYHTQKNKTPEDTSMKRNVTMERSKKNKKSFCKYTDSEKKIPGVAGNYWCSLG